VAQVDELRTPRICRQCHPCQTLALVGSPDF
jgi:hypothetical protein